MAEHLPNISISRASTETKASSTKSKHQDPTLRTPPQSPRVDTNHTCSSSWHRYRSETPGRHRAHSPDVEWHIKWTKNSFPNGRVLVIDYISSEVTQSISPSAKRHIAVAAQEFQDLKSLKRFYDDPDRAHVAALRVMHIQNATWATRFLLTKFNIDHPSELIGMQGFSKWARYETPRQRNGKPFPHGRSYREQTDPWRNISRTAFGLDYLKVYPTASPAKRNRRGASVDQPINAKMMQLNAYEDSRCPHGHDVCVQRLSVYVQRALGPSGRVSPDIEVRNPYLQPTPNGLGSTKLDEGRVDLESLDNTNTVIVFETSASMLLQDCLVQPRRDLEKRWRRLSFYLRKDEALNDTRLAAQCTNMILKDIFHGLGVVWEEFLAVATDHVNILEEKIYENPADESRAPELWTNQAAWLKVDKVMWIHQDLVKEMQSHMRALAGVDEEEDLLLPPDWLSGTPAEFEKLGHSVQEDLVQPTANLSDLMYKSVGIRDSRQSLHLGLSMWRLSWITFIFLPLTFVVSLFGANVNVFQSDPYPNIGWIFVAAAILMVFVLFLWYCVKHSLQRRRQTPYQRGLYEHLFDQLEDNYPLLWSSTGAASDIEPTGFINKLKWRLLKQWFAPERTINKKLYSSLAEDDAELGTWARFKRRLLRRWLPQILAERRISNDMAMAELGSSRASIHTVHSEPTAVNALAELSTPLALAGAEPVAVQPISIYGLRPLSLTERRAGSPKHSSEERPSSRGSSGIMIEERNLSDSESEAGEGAHDRAE